MNLKKLVRKYKREFNNLNKGESFKTKNYRITAINDDNDIFDICSNCIFSNSISCNKVKCMTKGIHFIAIKHKQIEKIQLNTSSKETT